MNNGFDKAQRDYDRQLPPGYDDDDDDEFDMEEETRSRAEVKLERELAKADMLMDLAKDEPRKIGSDIDRYLDKHPED